MKRPAKSPLAFKALFCTLVAVCVPWCGCPAYEGEIDFGYAPGALLLDRTGHEKATLVRFIRAVLDAAEFSPRQITVRDFPDQRTLHDALSAGRIVVAAVPPEFFSLYESPLDLEPLVVPLIGGSPWVRHCLFARAGNTSLQSPADLWGRRLAMLDYSDEWYRAIYSALDIPEVLLKVRLPDHGSVVMSVVSGRTPGGTVPVYGLNRFLSDHPGFRAEIKVFAETEPMLLPPMVYQKNRLTSAEAEKIASVLETAHRRDRLKPLLTAMGFSGFRRITRGRILDSAPWGAGKKSRGEEN